MSATMPALNVTAPLQEAADWLGLPETQEWARGVTAQAAEELERFLREDSSLRVPRNPEARAEAFKAWHKAYARERLSPWLRAWKSRAAREVHVSAAPLHTAEQRRRLFAHLIWPEVEQALRQRADDVLHVYAIRGLALNWVRRKISDGLLVGVPERAGEQWRVPLYLRGSGAKTGELELSADGVVLADASALSP